jgi:hypothetical protein
MHDAPRQWRFSGTRIRWRGMLVYGDPQFTSSPSQLINRLREMVAQGASLDDARVALISAGELEQAIADQFQSPRLILAAQALTDVCAAGFLQSFSPDGAEEKLSIPDAADLLLNELGENARTKLTVKVPEGFAFYSLFPEQYVLAARKWAEEHNAVSPKTVFVVGLRSIGTALSAVVASTLNRCGWRTRRTSVRPTGHPFDRRAEIDAVSGGASFAIVVDEGPGLSGSSMAAAAEALLHVGFASERIAFFPAHDAEPGPAASERVRERWRQTKRYTADLSAVRWGGQSLPEILACKSADLFSSDVASVEDASGGLWRRFAYASSAEWPAAPIAFERAKFFVTLKSGVRVLWKFSGLMPVRESASHRSSLAIAPLARCGGFTAAQWIEGERLRISDLHNAMLKQIAAHITSVAGDRLRSDEVATGFDRLAHMLVCNSTEILGASAGRAAAGLATEARAGLTKEARRFGDGRLAPHEFIHQSDGRLRKADCGGHDIDHTMIGPQSVLWDFAGAAVEWNLNADQIAAMLRQGSVMATEATLDFYRAACAAFRFGMFALCPGYDAEAERAESAKKFYRRALESALGFATERSRDVHRLDHGAEIVHSHNAH